MYWHMWSISYKAAPRTEKCTAEVKAFLDVDRNACLLKCEAHLFSDTHETVSHDREFHRINSSWCNYLSAGQ